jgi:WD40 repeat protein
MVLMILINIYEIVVWNLKTGECKHTLKGHTEPITSVKMENSFIVSSSKDKTVKIWDDSTCKNTLSKHNDWVKLIDFNDTIIGLTLLHFIIIMQIVIRSR